MDSTRSKARKPTHPGEILREDVLPALDITQGELAKKLGVSPSRLTPNPLLPFRPLPLEPLTLILKL